MSKPSDPALWSKVKKRARATSLGSPAGRWSAEKAARAQLEYERQGGKWQKTNPPKARA